MNHWPSACWRANSLTCVLKTIGTHTLSGCSRCLRASYENVQTR